MRTNSAPAGRSGTYKDRMFAQRWVALTTVAAMLACTTTETIDGAALNALRQLDPAAGALVLEDPNGQRIRLDPRSKVRLILRDGRQTDWVKAGRLAVTEDGRVVDGKRYLALDQVETVEVENVDGVKTYFLTVGIVAVAAALVALAVMAGQGDDDGKMPGIGGSDDPPRLDTRTPGPGGPRFAAGGQAWFYADPWLVPPSPTFIVPIGGRPPAARSPNGPPAGPNGGPPAPGPPTKLFSESAVRRSRFAPMLQFELGYGFDERTGGGLGVGFGFAIAQMFELSGGVRLSDLYGPQRFTLGYVRAGGNFPLEAGDVFGAPIALDVAFGDQGFRQMRVLWGFRWRLDNQFEVALLPANPQLNRVAEDGELYWDFPSQVQLGYRF